MKKSECPKFIKIIYFDESSAQEYLDVVNGGRLDWSSEENKERAAKILAEIEAQAKGGFNIISFIKASISGEIGASSTNEVSRLIGSSLKSTLLTDYITESCKDGKVHKFENKSVYAPKNSVTMYKMYSSYLSVVPKEQMPIDMDKLNDALLGERGYYAMLIADEVTPKNVLRFNIKAFKNNYSLADLSKMNLSYYGIKVGTCSLKQLDIENEFNFDNNTVEDDTESILNGTSNNSELLDVYDVILAGVISE